LFSKAANLSRHSCETGWNDLQHDYRLP
jgi:hypothetical protein